MQNPVSHETGFSFLVVNKDGPRKIPGGLFFSCCYLESMRGISVFSILCCAFLLFPVKSGLAQDMTEIQPLTFGRFAIVDNTAPRTIVVAPDNSVTYDPEIVPNIEAERGEYALSGFPPNVTLYLGVNIANPPSEGGVTLDNQTDVTAGGAQDFSLGGFTINTANEVVTNATGDATLYIGGTLTTSGNGGAYINGIHNGQYDITFYW